MKITSGIRDFSKNPGGRVSATTSQIYKKSMANDFRLKEIFLYSGRHFYLAKFTWQKYAD